MQEQIHVLYVLGQDRSYDDLGKCWVYLLLALCCSPSGSLPDQTFLPSLLTLLRLRLPATTSQAWSD